MIHKTSFCDVNRLIGRRIQSILDNFASISRHNSVSFQGGLGFLTAMSGKWKIWLVCPERHHEPIALRHQTPTFVGRTPEMRIVDPRCSRKQVELTADARTGIVDVKLLGTNSSAIDGIEMIKDRTYTMKANSTLHVLTGCYPQQLKMEKLSDASSVQEKHKSGFDVIKKSSSKETDDKRRSSDSEASVSNRKKQHLNNETNNKSSQDKERHSSSSNKKKRPSTDHHSEAPSTKKAKHSESDHGKTSSSKLTSEKSSEDETKMKDIAGKIAAMKEANSKHNLKSQSKSTAKASESSDSFKPDMPPPRYVKPAAASPSASKGSEPRWREFNTMYIYESKGVKNRSKIAGFDIDGTIITTKSGKVFATDTGDWRLLYYQDIMKKLKKLHESEYKIVFFTNQMGVSRGKVKIDELKNKFEAVVKAVEVPVQILVSTKGGLFRKPCTGMWNMLGEKYNGGVEIDESKSFYVGDAAGRPKDWQPKAKKDFSSSDRLFALNIGLSFKTPEEYFLNSPTAKYVMPEFDPRKLSSKADMFDPKDAAMISGKQEVIVLAGYPASGKSFFAKTYLEAKGYVHISRDKLGTWQKCVKACTEALKKGNCVVIDNTNPDVQSRARYVEAASAVKVPCRCFVFTTTLQHARHNERYREITDPSHDAINDIVMNSFKGKYTLPEKKEGFTEVVKVSFVPSFQESNLEALYRMFLLEK